MQPFFGVDNRLAAILVSLITFGYAVYTIVTEGVIRMEEQLRLTRISDSSSDTFTQGGRTVDVKYNFESTSSYFGLYELEISMIKACVSFLLFIVLLVGASQRSKLLLRVWMMIDALVIVLGFLSPILSSSDNHLSSSGTPMATLTKFLITICLCIWFLAVVVCLHEEIELEERNSSEDGKIKSCSYVSRKGQDVDEKCAPYYDC